jgi:hypothetical protein
MIREIALLLMIKRVILKRKRCCSKSSRTLCYSVIKKKSTNKAPRVKPYRWFYRNNGLPTFAGNPDAVTVMVSNKLVSKTISRVAGAKVQVYSNYSDRSTERQQRRKQYVQKYTRLLSATPLFAVATNRSG